jgi:hypothetical protein
VGVHVEETFVMIIEFPIGGSQNPCSDRNGSKIKMFIASISSEMIRGIDFPAYWVGSYIRAREQFMTMTLFNKNTNP